MGNLHTPIHHDSDSVIVVTGSWTTVKEQQAEFYARLLAAEGFTTLTFDFRGFGQSEGAPRSWENPGRKISDIHAAVTYATEQLGAARIGALGICASSGYQAVNAASDSRVNSLAMIAPWLHNMQLVAPYYGGEAGVPGAHWRHPAQPTLATGRRARSTTFPPSPPPILLPQCTAHTTITSIRNAATSPNGTNASPPCRGNRG